MAERRYFLTESQADKFREMLREHDANAGRGRPHRAHRPDPGVNLQYVSITSLTTADGRYPGKRWELIPGTGQLTDTGVLVWVIFPAGGTVTVFADDDPYADPYAEPVFYEAIDYGFQNKRPLFAAISAAGSGDPLTVEDQSGTPSVENVTTLQGGDGIDVVAGSPGVAALRWGNLNEWRVLNSACLEKRSYFCTLKKTELIPVSHFGTATDVLLTANPLAGFGYGDNVFICTVDWEFRVSTIGVDESENVLLDFAGVVVCNLGEGTTVNWSPFFKVRQLVRGNSVTIITGSRTWRFKNSNPGPFNFRLVVVRPAGGSADYTLWLTGTDNPGVDQSGATALTVHPEPKLCTEARVIRFPSQSLELQKIVDPSNCVCVDESTSGPDVVNPCPDPYDPYDPYSSPEAKYYCMETPSSSERTCHFLTPAERDGLLASGYGQISGPHDTEVACEAACADSELPDFFTVFPGLVTNGTCSDCESSLPASICVERVGETDEWNTQIEICGGNLFMYVYREEGVWFAAVEHSEHPGDTTIWELDGEINLEGANTFNKIVDTLGICTWAETVSVESGCIG